MLEGQAPWIPSGPEAVSMAAQGLGMGNSES